MLTQPINGGIVQQYRVKPLVKFDNRFLESLLSPVYLQEPQGVNQRIGCVFDQLSDSTQSHILNSFLLHCEENVHPETRSRFLQLIQPCNSSVQELVQWIWNRYKWEQTMNLGYQLVPCVSQDASWSLLHSSRMNYSSSSSDWKQTNNEFQSNERTMEETGHSDKLPNHKRKRKDDPWHSIIKTMKTNSLSSEKVVQVLKNTCLDQLIASWKAWFGRPLMDRGGGADSMDDGGLLCIIGNEILHSCVDSKEENYYSTAYLVAVISYLFVPFVVRLRYGASRQVLLLFIEWAKKWPLLMQQYFILPLLCNNTTLQAPQVEVIGKVTQNSFSSYLVQDTMRIWLTQSIAYPWNESILVLLEQWLFQVNESDIIILFIGKLEANAPFVELSPKWIKLLYDLCQQHLSICLEYRHILAD